MRFVTESIQMIMIVTSRTSAVDSLEVPVGDRFLGHAGGTALAVLPAGQAGGRSRYPVTSAGSPQSGPRAGVEVEHPAAVRPRPLPVVCYASGADGTGYPL